MNKKDSIEYFKRIFKMYKIVNDISSTCIEHRPQGRNGIAVKDDYWAIKWQSIQMREELLLAFLEGRKPNWAYAGYLSLDEKEKRNKSYTT